MIAARALGNQVLNLVADPPFFTRKSVNREYCIFFNVEPEQVIGQSCLDTTPKENRDEVCRKIESCIQNDAVLTSIETAIKTNGTKTLIQWVDVPVKDKTGKIIELLSIGSPMKDRREKEIDAV